MRRLLVIVPVLAACSTYAQHQAALVPNATPLPYDGQPLAATSTLSLGASNVDLVAPRAAQANVGDAVPSVQLRGELAFGTYSGLVLGGVYETGTAQSATPLSASQPPFTGGPSLEGAGLTFGYSIRTSSPNWRIGIAGELLVWSVPWIQYTTCIENCMGVPVGNTVVTTGSDDVPTFALAVVPSYHVGPWTLFGGITARNQPTTYATIDTQIPSSVGVQWGDINATLHVGGEVELSRVRLSLIIDQTVTAEPIRYGPAIAAMVTLPLGAAPTPR